MGLTAEQQKLRSGKLTASAVAKLVTGSPEEINNLWRLLIGDPSYVEEDLSGNFAVQLGSFTESFHLDWYERQTCNKLTRRGEVVNHSTLAWAACTLDGWDSVQNCPVEVKHVNGFSKMPDVIARYMAQLHWQMVIMQTRKAILSVIIGTNEPVRETVLYDTNYGAELIRRAEVFMRCVDNMVPPLAMPAVAAPVSPEAFRTIDLDAMKNDGQPLPNWAHMIEKESYSWLETRAHHSSNEEMSEHIKKAIPLDVGKFSGWGITISRAKNNSLTIKEKKEKKK